MTSEPLKILVVDGNRVGRKFYSRLLKQHFAEGCRILEVGLGEDGLFFCGSEEISCVLVDFKLPDMDCLKFMKLLNEQLKGKSSNTYIPVVVITGEGNEGMAVDAMKAGVQDYLVKGSFSQERLAKAITNAMEKVELHKLLERKHRDLEHANNVLTNEILERKRVEESLRLFRDLTNQTVDSLFIIDPSDGSLMDFNDSACDNLGYTRKEMARLKISAFDVGIESEKPRKQLVAEIVAKGRLAYESTFLRKDGERFPVEVTVKHIHRDDQYYLVGLARDITQRKKVESQLRDLSNRDGLTGVYNRRYLNEVMEREWKRLKREKKPLSLIMLDVDFFKRYNDHYGHQAGDDCLKRVAGCLVDGVKRPADVLARYGGEEFVVILPSTDTEGARHVAEGLRKAIVDANLVHEKSSMGVVTMSIGVACLVPEDDSSTRVLFQMADGALYQAKENGRNRVAVVQ